MPFGGLRLVTALSVCPLVGSDWSQPRGRAARGGGGGPGAARAGRALGHHERQPSAHSGGHGRETQGGGRLEDLALLRRGE
eukprot:1192165-Prorocentrum_minimum.AAC.3